MKTKKIIFFCISAVAVVAVIVGLCCFFLAAKPIREVPSALKIDVIDGQYHIEAEYGGEKYGYEFRIEQKFDNEFVVIDTVESKVNIVDLSTCNITLVEGQKYRFSARYTYESEKGQFSKYLEWDF